MSHTATPASAQSTASADPRQPLRTRKAGGRRGRRAALGARNTPASRRRRLDPHRTPACGSNADERHRRPPRGSRPTERAGRARTARRTHSALGAPPARPRGHGGPRHLSSPVCGGPEGGAAGGRLPGRGTAMGTGRLAAEGGARASGRGRGAAGRMCGQTGRRGPRAEGALSLRAVGCEAGCGRPDAAPGGSQVFPRYFLQLLRTYNYLKI